MSKRKRIYCSNKTCVVRTCSRNICHHTGRFYRNTDWIRLGPDTCELYKGLERFSTLFQREEIEEDE